MEKNGMALRIPAEVADALRAAARRAAPLEACGLLAGRDGRVEAFHEIANVDASRERYTMRPEDQFAAVKAMRAAGRKLVGIWHSHPDTPARMSEEDLRLAYTPGVFYVITSLAPAGRPDLRGFRVEAGAAREVDLVTEPAANGEQR